MSDTRTLQTVAAKLPCPCHPENEDLLTRLGSKIKLPVHEMVKRTIDHAVYELSKRDEHTYTDFSIDCWHQEIFDLESDKYVRAFFSVAMIGDESQYVFVSINGCFPKYLTYPGRLFWAALRDRALCGDLDNKEFWDAVMMDNY